MLEQGLDVGATSTARARRGPCRSGGARAHRRMLA